MSGGHARSTVPLLSLLQIPGLHTAAVSGVTGIDETSLRALMKIERVLPTRLRQRVTALQRAMLAIPPRRSSPAVDAAVLTAISAAIRAEEALRFDYVDHHQTASCRIVEPHRLVTWGRRWYLVGWDVDGDDWRTFRADRMTLRVPNGPRFTHRAPPDGDVAAYLRRTIGHDMWPYRCLVRVHAPAAQVTGRVDGIVTPIDDHTCLLELATDSFNLAALVVGLLDVDFDIESPPELAEHLRALSSRFAKAAEQE